jgi:hypothetical protein
MRKDQTSIQITRFQLKILPFITLFLFPVWEAFYLCIKLFYPPTVISYLGQLTLMCNLIKFFLKL